MLPITPAEAGKNISRHFKPREMYEKYVNQANENQTFKDKNLLRFEIQDTHFSLVLALLEKIKSNKCKYLFYFYWEKRRINSTVFQFALHCVHTYPHAYKKIHIKNIPNKKQNKKETRIKNQNTLKLHQYFGFDQKNRSWEEVQNAKSNDRKC